MNVVIDFTLMDSLTQELLSLEKALVTPVIPIKEQIVRMIDKYGDFSGEQSQSEGQYIACHLP